MGRSSRDVRTSEGGSCSTASVNHCGSSTAAEGGFSRMNRKSHVELRARARYARQDKLAGMDKAVSTSRIPQRSLRSHHSSLDRQRYTNSTEVIASSSSSSSSSSASSTVERVKAVLPARIDPHLPPLHTYDPFFVCLFNFFVCLIFYLPESFESFHKDKNFDESPLRMSKKSSRISNPVKGSKKNLGNDPTVELSRRKLSEPVPVRSVDGRRRNSSGGAAITTASAGGCNSSSGGGGGSFRNRLVQRSRTVEERSRICCGRMAASAGGWRSEKRRASLDATAHSTVRRRCLRCRDKGQFFINFNQHFIELIN